MPPDRPASRKSLHVVLTKNKGIQILDDEQFRIMKLDIMLSHEEKMEMCRQLLEDLNRALETEKQPPPPEA